MENEKIVGIKKQSIVLSIFLSVITFGIYFIYWKYLLIKNVRVIKNNTANCTGEILCIIFIPFYSFFWWFTMGEYINKEFRARSYNVLSNGISLLVIAFLGFSVISMSIMQNDFNSLPFTENEFI
ncbi:MAG: DUF4234 domain-containing protein [Oscillospiraceae bacterium]